MHPGAAPITSCFPPGPVAGILSCDISPMVDSNTVRKRMLLRLLGSPLTVLPFVIGMTTLAGSWALDWRPAAGAFAALAGCLISAGVFLTRLVFQSGEVVQDVLDETARSEESGRQKSLDDLDRLLTVADQDPRPETALRDLRALVKALEESAASSPGGAMLLDIHLRVGQLFDHCVASLRETDQLWKTSQRLATPAARQPLLDRREQLVADVQACTKQLSQALVALQSLNSPGGDAASLGRLRDDLDQSLAAARSAGERVESWIRDSSGRAPETPSDPQL